MPNPVRATCQMLQKEGKFSGICCTSCHEDEGVDYPLMGGELKDGRPFSVCCFAWDELRGRGLVEQ